MRAIIELLNLTELILASLLLEPIPSNSVGDEDDLAESDVESDSEDEKGVAVRVRRKNAMRRREDTRNTVSPGLDFDEEGEPTMDRESLEYTSSIHITLILGPLIKSLFHHARKHFRASIRSSLRRFLSGVISIFTLLRLTHIPRMLPDRRIYQGPSVVEQGRLLLYLAGYPALPTPRATPWATTPKV